MPKEPVNVPFATAAAKTFIARTPSYIVNPHNSKLMSRELIRLVEEEGCDPADVATYSQSFHNLIQELELREPEVRKPVEQMTPQELSALSPEEQDRLPSHLLKRVADYEFQKRSQKPEISEQSAFLNEVFELSGFAFSPANVAIVSKWMEERQLGYTAANLRLALCDCEDALTPSDRELSAMTADEYRKAIVEPEFRKRQAAQPKSESRVPWGVKTTEFIHNP